MKEAYLYESKKEDFLLTKDEENIMKQMRHLNDLRKKYKSKPNSNKFILYCGQDCTIRYGSPSSEYIIQEYEHISCDGGDGSDRF
jgi:hypothetical protein